MEKYSYNRVFKYDKDKVGSPKNILIKYVSDNNFLTKLGFLKGEYNEKDISLIANLYNNKEHIDNDKLKSILDRIYDAFVIAQIVTDVSYVEKSHTIHQYWFKRLQYDNFINDLKDDIRHSFSAIEIGSDIGKYRKMMGLSDLSELSDVDTADKKVLDELTPEQLAYIKQKYGI